MTTCWADLGSPDLGPELQKKIVDGVLEEVDGRSFEELSQERDTLIMGLLELLSHRGSECRRERAVIAEHIPLRVAEPYRP